MEGATGIAFPADLKSALKAASAEKRVVLVLHEPDWTNGTKRLKYLLGQNEEMAQTLRADAELVQVTPWSDPAADARLRLAAALAGADVGPPLLSILAPDGRLLTTYSGMVFEGGVLPSEGRANARPTLAATVQTARQWFQDQPCAPDDSRHDTADSTDPILVEPGGVLQSPPLRDLNPFHLLNLVESGQAAAAAALVEQMLGGGVWDHVFGGFHRAAREDRLILPQFEKPTLHNIAMAIVLAHLAHLPDASLRVQRASRRQRRFLAELLAGSETVLAAESDTKRHTWRAREFGDVAGPEFTYVGGLRFGIQNHDAPLVLYEARNAGSISEITGMTEIAVQEQVVRLEARLARFKEERHPLRRVHSDDPYDRLSTLWLLACYEVVDDQRPLGQGQHDMAVAALESLLETGAFATNPAATAAAILLVDGPGVRLDRSRRDEIINELLPVLVDQVGEYGPESGVPLIGLIDSLRLPQGGMMIRALMQAGARIGSPEAQTAGEHLVKVCAPLVNVAGGHVQAFRWLVPNSS